MPYTLIAHGGAGNIAADQTAAHAAGIRQAIAAGCAVLAQGGAALDAVQTSVMVLEDLPAFNAGHGACLTSAGTIEMDAGLMDGESLRVGALAALSNVANPIALCRLIMERSDHILFAGAGALAFAEAQHVPLVPLDELLTAQRRRELADLKRSTFADNVGPEAIGVPADTVGAVALDDAGRIAAACSTGGMSLKAPGRVGDSPLPGCGYYADSQVGGCVTTGWGETIARVLLARRAVEGLERGLDPVTAARQALDFLAARTGGWAGLILLDRQGNTAAAFNSLRMTYGWQRAGDAQPTVIA